MSNGKDCQCAARCEYECACGADWTTDEVYTLRAEVERWKLQAEGLHQINISNSETLEKEIIALQVEKDAWQGRFYAADGKLSENQQDVQTTADALGNIQRQFESVSQDRDDWIACHAKIFRELQETKTLLANKCFEFDYFIDAAIKDRDYYMKERDALQAKGDEQPTVPDGWLRAVDEEMTRSHLGVAFAADSYAVAKKKLADLIKWHVTVATDPVVNGGFKLVPVEPTPEMKAAGQATIHRLANDGIRRHWQDVYGEGYKAMLAAAPTPKGETSE